VGHWSPPTIAAQATKQRWSLNVASDQFDDSRRSCLLDALDDFNSLAAIGVFSLSGLEVICELEAIGHGSDPSAYIAATIGRSGQRRPDETGD
jgi:hypothetical protein